jgi:N-acetylglucosaminyldiphosphoundecaprenol N-acetyl-beta-D-mannosaminyltransferase
VAPCIVAQSRRPDDAAFRNATCTVRVNLDQCYLYLSGPRDQTNLAAVRQALAECTDVPSDIVIRLRDVSYVDSAFLGLCLLLYGHQRKIGRKLTFEGVDGRFRRTLRAHCADYLLD